MYKTHQKHVFDASLGLMRLVWKVVDQVCLKSYRLDPFIYHEKCSSVTEVDVGLKSNIRLAFTALILMMQR